MLARCARSLWRISSATSILVVGAERGHEPFESRGERRADAHARDMRDRAQHMRGAPAAYDDIALRRQRENLFGLEQCQVGLVGAPAFEQSGLALDEALQRTLAQMHLLGHVINDLVAHDLQAKFLCKFLGN